MILTGRKHVAHWPLGDNFDSCCHGHLIESRFVVKAEWLLRKLNNAMLLIMEKKSNCIKGLLLVDFLN